MFSLHSIVLFLQTLLSTTHAQNTITTIVKVTTTASLPTPFPPLPTPLTEVATPTTLTSPLPLATPGSLSPEGGCAGTSSLLNFCPACGGSIIPYGDNNVYSVLCDSIFADVRYYADMHFASVYECIEACRDMAHCYAPVISPRGRCLLAIEKLKVQPVVVAGMGYAALMPRVGKGWLPPTGSYSEVLATKSSETGAQTTTSASHTAHICEPDDIICPDCDGAQVKDSLGKTHTVLCNSKMWSEKYDSVDSWLSPEGCMTECDKYPGCKGSSFWGDRNCIIAAGEDAFPVSMANYTAFIPAATKTPSPALSTYPSDNATTTPVHKPSFPTASSSDSTASPVPSLCNRQYIECPECSNMHISEGLNQTYCVRCDLQPICTVVEGRHEHDTPNACMEQCDRLEDCQAAIVDQGECVLCRGTIESFRPWVWPHRFAVFVAEAALKSVGVDSVVTRSASWI